MVESAVARLGLTVEVAIHIEKALPVQGGMGAGSANAAAALIGLERELGVEVPGRMEIAAEVGSDVPLFLIGGAVLGVGRGEVVSAMPDLPATWCVVAVPEVGVSTPRAFQEWDGLCAAKRQGTGIREQGTTEEGPGLKPLVLEADYRLRPRAEALGYQPAAAPGDPATTSDERSAAPRDKDATGGGSPLSLLPIPGSLPRGGGLTSPVEPDRLEELSHAYASVFGFRASKSFEEAGQGTEQAPDTSGIVGGLAGLESFQQGDTRNDLAGNILLALVRTGIENDFEQVVFPQYPLLREIKHELMGNPAGSSDDFGQDQPASGKAVYAALSGSGSALFGLYRSEAGAKAAQQRVQATGCKAILTETLPRQEYWRRMFAE
jgi:4-diphosphocytidyl-2-C-methyl-D-erythritol kinase